MRRYLHEHMHVTAERATHYAQMTSTPTFDFRRLVHEGILPPHTPNRTIRSASFR